MTTGGSGSGVWHPVFRTQSNIGDNLPSRFVAAGQNFGMKMGHSRPDLRQISRCRPAVINFLDVGQKIFNSPSGAKFGKLAA
jgi:hypothetical protein